MLTPCQSSSVGPLPRGYLVFAPEPFLSPCSPSCPSPSTVPNLSSFPVFPPAAICSHRGSSLAQRFSSLGNHGPSPPKPGSHQRPRLPTQLFPRPRLCLCILSANAQQKHSATMSFQLPLKDFSKNQGPGRLQSPQRKQKPTWIQSKPGPRRENYPGRETNPKVNTARTSVSEAVYERNQDSLRLPVGAHFQRPSSARHPVGISTPRALLHRRQDPANE